MQKLHQLTGVPFRLINPWIGDYYSRLQSTPGCVQIVNGFVIANSFFAVILPPNWNKFAGPGTYPILVNAHYDVNENLFGYDFTNNVLAGFGLGQSIAQWIAESGTGGRTGAIGVIWNGGASISSITANDYARTQFAQIIDLVSTYAGGDRYRVLVSGGSRGGLATLMLASNPEGIGVNNYRVTYAAASVPGTKLGTHASLISTTMPAQLSGFATATGFADSWRPNWVYPSYGRPELVGLSAVQASLQVFSGSTDPAWVDANRSPISQSFINGLKNAQTQVALHLGTHDEFMPFGTQAEYLFRLKQEGVPVEAHIVVRGGHSPLNAVEPNPGQPPHSFYGKLRLAMLSYVQPGTPVSWRMAVTGPQSVRYYAVNRTTNNADLFAYEGLELPFTLEVPRLLYVGMPIIGYVTGQPGTYFEVHTNAGNFSGTIGNTMTWVFSTQALSAGQIVYNHVYMKTPSMPALVEIPAYTVPGVNYMTLTTDVLQGPPPLVGNGTLWNQVKFPCLTYPSIPCMTRVPGFGETNWGMSQY
jgi:hypothetical protein